jgi:hypothetical protein
MIKWTNETKSYFFEKANKINKAFTKLTKSKGKRHKLKKLIGSEGDITTDINEIQKLIWENFESLYSSKQ